MRIAAVRAWLVEIPLSEPFVISRGALDCFRNVVVAVETDAGITGHGEAVPVSLLGDPDQYRRIIVERFAPVLIGRDPEAIEPLVDELLGVSAEAGPAPVAGVDLALWDILGQRLGVPVSTLLGGAAAARVEVDYTISADTPTRMAETARAVVQAGFRGVVVKVACRSPTVDAGCVRAVRHAAPRANLRVDCNGGYDRDRAAEFLGLLDGLDIDFIEQPVPAADIEGMASCRRHGLRIAADESLATPADALRLLRAEACDVMNVKVPKAGGLLQARRVAAIASAAGLPLVVGGGLSFGISRFASQHLAAAATPCRGLFHQGPGPASQALTDDVTLPRVERADVGRHAGAVAVPTAPGLGFRLDADRLARYAVPKREGA